ncbi:MAG: methionyl-tRNA formyltransferase [Clostridia bacterium]|nr:methionyl-tRNA formyltransferase [Clostridia bacterium]
MRVVFLGTPDFAVNTLKALISSKHEIVAVVTQPDKPVGRSGKPVFSPVKEVAVQAGLKVLQYNKIRLEGVADLKALNADIMVTCAFGQILSQEIIDIAPKGIINVHASLLPKYRGAAPIQWSIINGDEETGVTIMQTEAGIDTGDIIAVEKTPIMPTETAGELFDRLSYIGADLLVKTIDKIEEGTATYTPQDHNSASHVKMLKKEDGIIDFNKSSKTIYNFIRGMNPWPCAFTFLGRKALKVYKAEVVNLDFVETVLPGTIVKADSKSGLIVSTADGFIRLSDIQVEGGKRMPDSAYLLGHTLTIGEKLNG